ncbi:MAG: Ig domain protein group 2 domain protein [Geminicoccaceae bacterium]|nr:Ig domain protein group 2 domain protein [Geminicoccaceae bacterium]
MFSISRTTRAWLLASVAMTAACAGDEGTAPIDGGGPITGPERVTVSPTLDSLLIGQSKLLTARVVDQQGAAVMREVSWSSVEPSIASVATDGLVTAVSRGTARVVARVGNAADTALIVVIADLIPFQVLPNAASVMEGELLQLSVTSANGASTSAVASAEVHWASSDPAIATVSEEGVVQALVAGDVTLLATIDNVTSTAAVRVNKTSVDAVSITPTNSTVDPGETTQLEAVVFDDAGRVISGKKLNWRSSNDAIASVDDDGVVTGSTKGSTVITVQAEGRKATATINVLAVPVATVSASLGTSALSVGQTTTATATLEDADGNVLSDRTIAWQSSNPALVTVNSAGLVTAVAAGSVTITAIAEGKTASVSLTVAPAAPTAILITPSGASLSPDQTAQLTAEVRGSDGTVMNRPVAWASDRIDIATVSPDGLVTAHAAGTASITATSDGVLASVPVTVSAPSNQVSSVTVTLQHSSLLAGQSTQATAVSRNAAGEVIPGTVSWSSTDEELATVSATGVVNAVKAGSVTIIATIDGVAGMQSLSINPPPVAAVSTVTLTATTTTLKVGQTAQLTAVLKDASGNTLTNRSIGWSSSNPTVATVSVTGVVTAVGGGSVTISATSEGQTGVLPMTVSSDTPAPVTVATVTVQLGSTSVQAGGSTSATAVARDASGSPIGGVSFVWSSSNTSVATVSQTGAVSAVAAGTAAITATGGGKTGSQTLTVTAPPPSGSAPKGVDGVKWLAGPVPSVSASKSLGTMFATYEDDFVKYADYHWAAHGANWEQANYYDRAAIYYVWWARTGNATYVNRANAIALDYRTKYLEGIAMPYTYNASTYWHMPLGLALHYLVTGDEKSRQAVGYSAEWLASVGLVSGIGKKTTMALVSNARTQSPIGKTLPDPIPVGTAENRWRARVLQASVLAHAINAPQNGPATGYGKGGPIAVVPGTWAEKAKAALDQVLGFQNPDGSYRDEQSGGAEKPFMDGLLNDALILYYQFVSPDPRILSAVRRNLDYNWANTWLGHTENSPTFAYYEWNYTSPTNSSWAGSRGPAGDLNLMMVNAFGWVYAMTGDAAYRDRGNQVFKGGVDLGYLQGSKQFNQSYEGSWRFIGYRLGIPAAQ